MSSSSSSRLPCDPHAVRRTKQKAPAASAAAAQLLRLRRGGRAAAAMDESIEFFSALRLRECQPDPAARVSSPTGIVGPDDRRREKASRRSSGDDSGLLLSTEIVGKHDYDWLLTPPATSSTTAALNRLTRATSASYAKTKSNSPLALAHRRPENGNPTSSRLARSSSATHSSLQVMNTPEFASSSSRPPHLRTLSSPIKDASNASGPPLGSAATSRRTPVTARSAPASSPSRAQSKLAQQVSSGSGSGAAGSQQPRGRSSSSNSGPPAPTNGPSSGPKSTCRVASASAARSRFASQLLSSAIMSTAQPAQNVVRSSSTIKLRQPVTAAVRQCRQPTTKGIIVMERWR